MVGEPRDRTAYSVAIGCLGLALVILLIGICWIAVENSGHDVTDVFTHKCALDVASCRPALYEHSTISAMSIPDGLWIALAAIGGALVGALIPFSTGALVPDSPQASYDSTAWKWKWDFELIVITVLAALAATLVIIVWADSLLLFAIAGLLLGLLIPSPARRD